LCELYRDFSDLRIALFFRYGDEFLTLDARGIRFLGRVCAVFSVSAKSRDSRSSSSRPNTSYAGCNTSYLFPQPVRLRVPGLPCVKLLLLKVSVALMEGSLAVCPLSSASVCWPASQCSPPLTCYFVRRTPNPRPYWVNYRPIVLYGSYPGPFSHLPTYYYSLSGFFFPSSFPIFRAPVFIGLFFCL